MTFSELTSVFVKKEFNLSVNTILRSYSMIENLYIVIDRFCTIPAKRTNTSIMNTEPSYLFNRVESTKQRIAFNKYQAIAWIIVLQIIISLTLGQTCHRSNELVKKIISSDFHYVRTFKTVKCVNKVLVSNIMYTVPMLMTHHL